MGYKAAPAVAPDLSNRVDRDLELKALAKERFAEQEEHEVRIKTRDIKMLMAAADENGDGFIDYDEFIDLSRRVPPCARGGRAYQRKGKVR